MKVKLEKEDYIHHLQEQVQFLKTSCDSYDKGFTGEAKKNSNNNTRSCSRYQKNLFHC
ncbi:hypothetical protein RWE15_23835 [Virgibacillus halophilus]|uniref:Uncharacterized protein n=1 Tax=Tigheibacillus halophilus TaxID=361280 RepID=A0ABU5CC44_9BACI|nr:hypothetical protein [Virgibacillus halophilus]MDY0396769.1 hypothetical protein [Virgibacillus halophilus]